MKEPQVVGECIAAMQNAVRVPVTVKCRLGVDEQEDYDAFLHFIDTVSGNGCAEFVVHARKAWLSGLSPKENREIPPLRYDWVFRLKQERPNLRIVLNGGLAEVDDCLEAMPKVDGVMIGRAAYQDPFRLHRMHAAIYGGPEYDREHLLLALQDYVTAQCASGVALKHISKCLFGLFHGQPGGRLFRQVLSQEAPLPGAGWPVIAKALAATRLREVS